MLLLLLVSPFIGFALAVNATAPDDITVTTAEDAEHGTYLTDSEGRAVYMFLPDDTQDGFASQCYDDCAKNWPPVSDADGADAGEGVGADLIGTHERRGGASQVTYGGWPLYYFGNDASADTSGQGVGDNWFLVSPAGKPIGATAAGDDASDEPADAPTAADAQEDDEAADEPSAEDAAGAAEDGDAAQEEQAAQDGPTSVWAGVYTEEQAERGDAEYDETCAGCHGPDLGGTPGGPSLRGPRFMFAWDGESVGALFEYTSTMMPIDRPGILSDQEYIKIVARILQANEFPTGDAPLPIDQSVLDQIVIEREE